MRYKLLILESTHQTHLLGGYEKLYETFTHQVLIPNLLVGENQKKATTPELRSTSTLTLQLMPQLMHEGD